MRKVPQDEVAAAARRRLELLGLELDRAGLARLDGAPPRPEPAPEPREVAPADALRPPEPVRPSGRHAVGRVTRPEGRVRETLAGLVPDTLRGRVALDRGVFVVVVVLAVTAVGAAAVAVGRQGATSSTAPAASPSSAAPLVTPAADASAAGGAAAGGAESPGPTAVPAGAPVVVHVAGKVRRPGVVELPGGARVADAVDEAGGPRRGVSLDGLNLARVLVDGEQLVVGGPAPPPDPATGPAAGAASTAAPATGALVSLNSGTLDQLDTIPGVGPVTAQKILDWRDANGAFSAVDELLEIDGIGDKTLAEIAPHVTL